MNFGVSKKNIFIDFVYESILLYIFFILGEFFKKINFEKL